MGLARTLSGLVGGVLLISSWLGRPELTTQLGFVIAVAGGMVLVVERWLVRNKPIAWSRIVTGSLMASLLYWVSVMPEGGAGPLGGLLANGISRGEGGPAAGHRLPAGRVIE